MLFDSGVFAIRIEQFFLFPHYVSEAWLRAAFLVEVVRVQTRNKIEAYSASLSLESISCIPEIIFSIFCPQSFINLE